MDWRRHTTSAYRRGYVEGQAGAEDAYLLKAGLTDPQAIAEYEQGFRDGEAAALLDDWEPS
jgi:hypothetical protein